MKLYTETNREIVLKQKPNHLCKCARRVFVGVGSGTAAETMLKHL